MPTDLRHVLTHKKDQYAAAKVVSEAKTTSVKALTISAKTRKLKSKLILPTVIMKMNGQLVGSGRASLMTPSSTLAR